MASDPLFRNIWILFPNCSDLINESHSDPEKEVTGEFIYNLAKYLVENEYHVIILTSHCPTQMQDLFDKGLTFFEKSNFSAKGNMFSHFFNDIINYEATFYSGVLNGVRLILFHGLNGNTQKLLQYNPLQHNFDNKLFLDKTVLLSRIMKEYANDIGPIEFPDIIHSVNTIFVPSVITLKNEFSYVGKKVGVVFQLANEPITLPVNDLTGFLLEACEVEDISHRIYHKGRIENLGVKDVVKKYGADITLTQLGAIESNLVIVLDSSKDNLDSRIKEKTKIIDVSHIENSKNYKDTLNIYSLVIRSVTSK